MLRRRHLSGTKVDTIRKRHAGLPRLGEVVGLSVGPRRAFATAIVVAVEPVSELPAERRDELAAIYGDDARDMVRVSFRVTGDLTPTDLG